MYRETGSTVEGLYLFSHAVPAEWLATFDAVVHLV